MQNGWYVIINPVAGGGNASRYWPRLSKSMSAAQLNYESVQTKGPGHAIQLVQAGIQAGFRSILTLGGDGTINEVVNGIFQQKLTSPSEIFFAAVSVGTGSDWARMYNLPRKPDGVAHMLKQQKTLYQDVGMLTCSRETGKIVRYFDNIAGLGYDAYVTDKTSHLPRNGISGQFFYFKALLSGLLTYKPVQLSIEGDGVSFSGSLYSANVAICRYNGGGMRPLRLLSGRRLV